MSIENTRKRILDIAKVYLGYREGYDNDNMFGDWYGLPRAPWCAMFVSYCMAKAGVSQDVVPKFSSCSVGWNWFASRGLTRPNNYIPQKGDIIFFDWEPEKGDGMDHVGLVDRVENSRVYTVEGNHSDQVIEYSYPLNYYEIYGYAIPNYTGNEILSESNNGSINFSDTTRPLISRGSCGSYVTEAQNALIQKRYPLNQYGADGIFGNETEQVVRKFQRDNGLSSDGIIGPATWGKLITNTVVMPSTYPGSYITIGHSGSNVLKIQNELIRRGYTVSGGADGQFGSGCKAAVQQFQSDRGLDVDGIVGKATWDELFPQSGIGSSYPGYVLDMGARGPEVTSIQNRLMALGYTIPGGADGQFGSGLKNAIRQYQTDKGLDVDGSVGKATWDLLFPLQEISVGFPGYLLGLGMSGQNVKIIQNKLSDLGYAIGAIDSIFGEKTKAAVIQFQTDNSLDADGVIGQETWNKLFTISSNLTTSALNEPVFKMLGKLYSYAGNFLNSNNKTDSIAQRNILVLQYLRRENYHFDVFEAIALAQNPTLSQSSLKAAAKELAQAAFDLIAVSPSWQNDWLSYMDNIYDSSLNINPIIHLDNNEEMELDHLAVTAETCIMHSYLIENLSQEVFAATSDLIGWAGDAIQFAGLYYKSTNEKTLSAIKDNLFLNSGNNYGFGLQDLYQDVDAWNMHKLLFIEDIETVFRKYYDSYTLYVEDSLYLLVIDLFMAFYLII